MAENNNESSKIEWYVVHTYSGYENKVMSSLQKTVENNGLQDRIVDIQVPVEDVIEIKNGKRRTIQRKILPGYVMVKMLLTNDTWYVVRNTRGVTGFVGAGNKALPLSETDFASLFDPSKTVRSDIQVGDSVRILTGLFENFTGRVVSIDEAAGRVHVVVPMLKRETDVELALDEVLPDQE